MSSTGVCTHCGCTEIDKDPARGDAVCTNCGSVLEDQIIVSEIQFEEHATGASSVIGQFVSTDGSKSHSLGISFPHGMKKESRTVTFDNGRKRIQQLGVQLKLNQHCIDTAFNFFKMAVNRRMTQGRKTTHVIAACLYIINVYSLGKTYLQLSRALCINIPAIDPCLYIPRFAHKLEFGEKTHEVSMTALRLVSRMKRDWMHTGRRPSGLCGADASNSPNISAENSRANSPDLSESGIKNASNFLEDETLKTCLNEVDLEKEKLVNEQEELKTERKPLQETIGMIDVVKKCVNEDEGESEKAEDGELDLTGIDDDELEKQFVLTEEEIELKTNLWMAENKDYLIALKEKEERLAKEREEEAKNPEKKKPKRTRKKRVPIQAASAEEAIYKVIHERKISNKINYDVLNDLKCQSGLQPATPVDSQPPPTPLQTEDLSEASRMVESNGSHIARDIKEPDRKKIKLEKMDFRDSKTESLGGDTSAVVVENGPVQYIENLKEDLYIKN
uniref:B-related factor 1 n=1 Tax=Magallana gigas TaxID=29159 RepID=K1PRX8_MAGGI